MGADDNKDVKNLLIPTTEETKKKELVSLLASLVKNYSKRKEDNKND